MPFKLKNFLLSVIMLIFSNAWAFSPTTHPVTVVIPFTPGGGVDQSFNVLENYARSYNITFIREYKPGADGIIGLDNLSKKPKDGYTIGITTAVSLAAFQIAKPNQPITVITGLNDTIGGIAVNASSPYNTIDELCQAISKGADIKFGYGAPGQFILLKQLISNCKAPGELLFVPYKGGNAVVMDLLSNQIDVIRVPIGLVIGHVNTGKLKLLAISRKQIDGLNTPTIESKFSNWQEPDGYGILVPDDTDPEAVDFWNSFLKAYIDDKEVQKQLIKNYMVKLPHGAAEFNIIVNKSKIELLKLKK